MSREQWGDLAFGALVLAGMVTLAVVSLREQRRWDAMQAEIAECRARGGGK